MEESCERKFWAKFLKLYENLPCLWNRKCETYSDKHTRQEAYEEMLTFCKTRFPNATTNFVVKKIHNFRCSFKREINKIKKFRKSEFSADGGPPTSLWYFNNLLFLVDNDELRESSWDCVDENDNAAVENKGKILTRLLTATDSESVNSIQLTEEMYSEDPSPSVLKQSTVRKKDSHKKSEREFKTLSDTFKNWSSAQRNLERKEDSYGLMGRKVSFDLREMDKGQGLIAEKLIGEILFYGKCGMLRVNDTFIPKTVMQSSEYSNTENYDEEQITENNNEHVVLMENSR